MKSLRRDCLKSQRCVRWNRTCEVFSSLKRPHSLPLLPVAQIKGGSHHVISHLGPRVSAGEGCDGSFSAAEPLSDSNPDVTYAAF